jgi:cold shock CspA family protein
MAEERSWFYMDSTGQEFGPYASSVMKGWFQQGFFPMQGDLQVRLSDMPEDQHFSIKDLYPSPIMERAFDGDPNLPSPSRGGKGGGRSGRGGAAPPPAVDPMAAYADAMMMGGMGGMGGLPGMPGAMNSPGMAPFGFPGMMSGRMPGMMPGMGMPLGPGAATGRFQGRIKSFNTQKGFGFVECPEAHQIYGRDVFLHKAQIGNFQIGSQVSFAVEMNKTNMPQARDLLESDMMGAFGAGIMGGMPGMMGGAKPYGGKGGGKGKGGGNKSAKPKGDAKRKAAPKSAGGAPAGALPGGDPVIVTLPMPSGEPFED